MNENHDLTIVNWLVVCKKWRRRKCGCIYFVGPKFTDCHKMNVKYDRDNLLFCCSLVQSNTFQCGILFRSHLMLLSCTQPVILQDLSWFVANLFLFLGCFYFSPMWLCFMILRIFNNLPNNTLVHIMDLP